MSTDFHRSFDIQTWKPGSRIFNDDDYIVIYYWRQVGIKVGNLNGKQQFCTIFEQKLIL